MTINAARTALLNRMGIDVWFVRPSAEDLAMAESPPAVREAPKPTPPPRKPAAQPVTEIATKPVAEPRAEQVPVEQFSLVCFRAADALLFSGPIASVSHRRLAHDIAVSASLALGSTPNKAELLEFRYPQISGSGGSGDWRRVLKAFTAKQVAVASPKLVMITNNAQSRFHGWYEDEPLIVPDVDVLAADAAQKKTLWLQIKSRLA